MRIMIHNGDGELPYEGSLDDLSDRDYEMLYPIIQYNLQGSGNIFMELKSHRRKAFDVHKHEGIVHFTKGYPELIASGVDKINYTDGGHTWRLDFDLTFFERWVAKKKTNDRLVLYSNNYDSICELQERVPKLFLYPNVQIRAKKGELPLVETRADINLYAKRGIK